MSRLAQKPLTIPQGVQISLNSRELSIKGSKGMATMALHSHIDLEQKESSLTFTANNSSRFANEMLGTTCSLVKSHIKGVSEGFQKKLLLVGVGYKAQAQGKNINLTLGISHPVIYQIPEGIAIETPVPTEIIIKGINKQQVGQVAAEIRRYRPPEPYKGKGIRYADEKIELKETKKK